MSSLSDYKDQIAASYSQLDQLKEGL